MFNLKDYFLFLIIIGTFSISGGIYITDANAQTQKVFPGDDEPDGEVGESEEIKNIGFTAESVANYNSIISDSDVSNVVVLLPDQRLTSEPFLPKDLTIVEGTKVIWINGQQNETGISILEDDEELFSNSTIPFKNATSYTFEDSGEFTYVNSLNPALMGKVTVIDADDAEDIVETNSTTKTIGVFIAPESEKEFWNAHLHSLGFNITSSQDIAIGPTSSADDEDEDEKQATLYLYTQKLDKYSSVVYRIDTKLPNVVEQLNEMEEDDDEDEDDD